MLPWLGERHGNPSSVHAFGQEARAAVETARQQVAASINALPHQIVFTSSGTEASNAVVLGRAWGEPPARVVLSAIEHPAVQAACERLAGLGWSVERVAPDGSGCVDVDQFSQAVTAETSLACLMLANNEVGTIQPVADVAALCREKGVELLCDAVQAIGKMPVDVKALDIDYLVLGAHKFNGPLGAAALWVREPARLEPFVVGGGQERGRRAGTENVAAVVGMGAAAELATRELAERRRHLARLRDLFEQGVCARGDARVHGAEAPRLVNTSNVAFPGVSAETLMIRLDLQGYAVSAGAACSSGKVEPSATLLAMGLSSREALSSIRVSFGMANSEADVAAFMKALVRELELLAGAPTA